MKMIYLFVLLILILARSAYSHPPKDVVASGEYQNLTIIAKHQVKDPSKHYIQSMTIFENGKQIAQKTYTKQEDADNFVDSIVINKLNPNTDKIVIQLVCNIMGMSEIEYLVK